MDQKVYEEQLTKSTENYAGKLVKFLEICDKAYYVDGDPIVSNETYDALVETLRKVDPQNPYLSKVGTKIQGNGRKVARLIPMGSLPKHHTSESVKEWMDKVKADSYLMAPKYDGFACELEYVDGKLVLASTRGDGTIGEDVTEAARQIVPLEVPANLTRVRGEFIIPKKHHEVLKAAGYTAMRNAVPGIIRSNNEYVKYVDFIAYEFFDNNLLRDWQRTVYNKFFKIEDCKLILNFEEAEMIRELWIEKRDNYEYEIDGLVIKTNEVYEDSYLDPLFQIAWKFKSNREATILRGVRAQLGISGRFTPVGEFDTVEFQGAKLTNASLGNFRRLKEMMENKDKPLKIGSMVEVSRRGDIIPYIEECTYTPDEAEDIKLLEVCPHCEHPIVWEDGEPYCRNNSCKELVKLRLSQYIAGSGMKGIGAGVIAKMQGTLINELPDIYKLDANKIAELPGLGQSMVEKWKSLQEKEMTPLQFVTCLPFTDIGPAVWKSLLGIWTIRELLSVTKEEIQSKRIRGMGESKIDTFISQRDALKSTIEELLNYVKLS